VGFRPTGVPDANGDTAFDTVDPTEDAHEACGDTPPALEPGAIIEKKVMFSRG
jgi:tRNA 2-thiocytidine biosynthesis protein TtcA